jgi:tetratricopeptide (TPR) repeat protein
MWPGFGWGGPRSLFFGNWYRGNWWGTRWGGWFGPGGMGFGRWGWRMGLFPTWRHWGLFGWGLGGWANSWLYGGFFNPYFVAPVINTTVVANAPPVFVPDYSRPLDLTSIAPEPENAEQEDLTFQAALDAFKAGDFARALSLNDLALKPHPNDPILHEFRALCLFALGRYDEAAGVLYVVLTAGPGWDWATMIGLYSDADTYTRQLRALEEAAGRDPAAASKRFVLAYHYLVQEHVEQARQQFEAVVKLQPKDQLAAHFVKLLTASSEAPAAADADSARAAETDQARQPSPPPAALVGTWNAKPAPDLSIELTVREDGQFTWDVNDNGQASSIAGEADYADGILKLNQDDAPALVGKVVNLGEKQFGLELSGGPQSAVLQFSR